MKYTTHEVPVNDAQKVSSMCFVCGANNPISLHAQFLELGDGRLCAEFTATDVHQSYPGRMHGGVISAILDETIGRAVQIEHPEIFGVTLDLKVRFRKQVPLNTPLKAIAWITEHTHHMFAGEGKLLLEDGSVAAEATARYFRMDVESITEDGLTEKDWFDDDRTFPPAVTV
jgi:uncharacterized protein (TIGR00369 family)